MSQYLSFITALVAFGTKNPEKLVQIWALIVAAYEASQKLAEGLVDTFNAALPREVGAVLTPDEEDAEKQFGALVPSPRGLLGNGKILRWLLGTSEGKLLLSSVLPLITGGK